MKYLVYDIVWDTSVDEPEHACTETLPEKMNVEIEYVEIAEFNGDEREMEEYISAKITDYLSEETGWCVEDCKYDLIEA